jgi:hypothetical protein
MSQNSEQIFSFTPAERCEVEAVFDEPQVTSDAGAVLVREFLERSELLRGIAAALDDDRRAGSIRH